MDDTGNETNPFPASWSGAAPQRPEGGTLAIGVDLGGTKIEAVVLAADGAVRWRERVPTPVGGYAAMGGGLSQIDRLVRRVPLHWGAHVFGAGGGARLETRLAASLHGDASGVRGAAWLGRNARA